MPMAVKISMDCPSFSGFASRTRGNNVDTNSGPISAYGSGAMGMGSIGIGTVILTAHAPHHKRVQTMITVHLSTLIPHILLVKPQNKGHPSKS